MGNYDMKGIGVVVKVVAVLPVHEEEETIYDVVKRVHPYVDTVFVVDDGSNDNTFKKAKEAHATVLVHEKNQGKWAALKTGFQRVLEDPEVKVIVQLDGDGQHSPEEIPKFIKEIRRGADLVVGCRVRLCNMPVIRRLSNRVSTELINLVFRFRSVDSQSGFRAYNPATLRKINPLSKRYEGETETLIKAQLLGLNIVEIPIRADFDEKNGGLSKLRCIVDPFDFMKIIMTLIVFSTYMRVRRIEWKKKAKAKIKEVVHLNHYDLASVIFIAFQCFLMLLNWNFQLRGNGADTLYHLLTGKMYYDHGWVDWDVYQFAPLGRPQLYPPLFYLIICFLRNMTIPFLDIGRLLSIIQWVGSLSSAWFFMRKLFYPRHGFYTLILLSSIGTIWSWQGGMTPTAFSTILLPPLLYCFLKKKIIPSIFLMSMLLWLHLGFPYLLILSFIIYSFWNRTYCKTLLWIVVPSLVTFLPWMGRLFSYRNWINGLQPSLPFWVSLLPLNFLLVLLASSTLLLIKWRNIPEIVLLFSCTIGFLPIIFTYGGSRFMSLAAIPLTMIGAVSLDQLMKKIHVALLKKILICSLLIFISVFEITLTTAETQPGIRGTDMQLEIAFAPSLRGILGSFGNNSQRYDAWSAFSFTEYDELVKWIQENTGQEEILHVSDTRLALYISLQTGRRVDKGMYFEVSSSEMYDKIEESWRKGRVYIFYSDETWFTPEGLLVKKYRFGNVTVAVTIKD